LYLWVLCDSQRDSNPRSQRPKDKDLRLIARGHWARRVQDVNELKAAFIAAAKQFTRTNNSRSTEAFSYFLSSFHFKERTLKIIYKIGPFPATQF
jgi:hypothetical protein